MPSAVNLETLAYIVTKTVKNLDEAGVLEGLRGVEVVPCLREGKNSVRVMRLSVHDYAIEKATTLLPSDLLILSPSDGITCGWYVAPPSAS